LQIITNFATIFTGKDIPWTNGDFLKYLGINEVDTTPQCFFYEKNRTMKTYETVTILKPQLNDNEVAALVEKIKGLITAAKGEVLSEEKLGRRRLSHEIKKNREGFYLYFRFKSEPNFVKKFGDTLKLNNSILRNVVMSYEEPKNKPANKKAEVAA